MRGECWRIVECYSAQTACAVCNHVLDKYTYLRLRFCSLLNIDSADKTLTSCDWGFRSHLLNTGSLLATSSPREASRAQLAMKGRDELWLSVI